MTIHYHGTPISPRAALDTLVGRFFCVSYARPDNIKACHEIGQGVMLDNGAFSVWRQGATADWPGYYHWADRWLDYPTTWAVIPDVIDGTDAENDALIAAWPHGDRGAPVWHLHEPTDRLLTLCDAWPRVCIGSSGEFLRIGAPAWERRMDTTFDTLATKYRRLPRLHMLRGMALSGGRWVFESVDSTDIGRNHNRPQNTAKAMAEKWDAKQCPPRWRANDDR